MVGIACPDCGSVETDVKDSRPQQAYVRRRRYCDKCGCRFTTHERVVECEESAESLYDLSGLSPRDLGLLGLLIAAMKAPEPEIREVENPHATANGMGQLHDKVIAAMTAQGQKDHVISKALGKSHGTVVSRRLTRGHRKNAPRKQPENPFPLVRETLESEGHVLRPLGNDQYQIDDQQVLTRNQVFAKANQYRVLNGLEPLRHETT